MIRSKIIRGRFNDVIVLADKAVSMFAFVLVLKYLETFHNSHYNIEYIFYGAIFAFLIGLNQDFNIKSGIQRNLDINKFIKSTLLLNVISVSIVFATAGNPINSLLFALTSSGRYEIIKYSGKTLAHKAQNIIAVTASIFMGLISFILGGEIITTIIFSYIIVKIIIGEALLFVLLSHEGTEETKSQLQFSPSLTFSGALTMTVGTLLPLCVAMLGESEDEILFVIMAIQRSISPAQQIGTLITRQYIETSDLRKEQFHFSLLGTIIAIIIFFFLVGDRSSLISYIILATIAYHATLSGSWTLKVSLANLQHLELLKILCSIIFFLAFYFLFIFFGISHKNAMLISYFSHLMMLYIPPMYIPNKLIFKDTEEQ